MSKMCIEVAVDKGNPVHEEALAMAEGVAQRLGPDIEVKQIDGDETVFYRVNDREVRGTDGTLPPEWMLEAAVLKVLQPQGWLFLCVANSARSQIGEGVARQLASSTIRVQSAGSHPTTVRPEAAVVLAEIGVDTESHCSKNVDEIDPATVDTVVTLCKEEECPLFLGKARRLHWGLPDPADVKGDESTRLDAFRQVRDELKKRISYIYSS